MKTLGIAEVVLNVRDLPSQRDFYQQVLSFDVLSEGCFEDESGENPDGDPTISFLSVGPSETPLGRNGHPPVLALIDFQRHVFARDKFDGVNQRQSSLNHIAFEIDAEDYGNWLDRLKHFQLETMEAVFRSFQARAIFFKDPEGNRVELICHQRSTV